MAIRRMFSKTITNSSRFLMMSPTAQLLYIHLSMNADDDGFVEHFPIMRMTEAKPDDLKLLAAREFVKVFDDRVLVITEWKENNYIQKDRYTPSKYLKIYKEELKLLAERTQDVYTVSPQVRLGKVRLGKEEGEKAPTPAEQARSFFSGESDELFNIFSKGQNPDFIRTEFKKFILYWTEPNKSGTKVRWEQQPTFDVKRRLYTWLSRSKQFSTKDSGRGIA